MAPPNRVLNQFNATLELLTDNTPSEFYDKGEWYIWSLILGTISGLLWIACLYQLLQAFRYSRIYRHGIIVDAAVNQKYLEDTGNNIDGDNYDYFIGYKYRVERETIRSGSHVEENTYRDTEIGDIVKIKYDPYNSSKSILLNGGKNGNTICRQCIYIIILIFLALAICFWIYWQSNHLNHFIEGIILGFSIVIFCIIATFMGYCIEQRILCFRTICIDDDHSNDGNKQRINQLTPKQKMYIHHYHNKHKKQKEKKEREEREREERERGSTRSSGKIELNISNDTQTEEDILQKKEIKKYTNRQHRDENVKHSHDENGTSFDFNAEFGEF